MITAAPGEARYSLPRPAAGCWLLARCWLRAAPGSSRGAAVMITAACCRPRAAGAHGVSVGALECWLSPRTDRAGLLGPDDAEQCCSCAASRRAHRSLRVGSVRVRVPCSRVDPCENKRFRCCGAVLAASCSWLLAGGRGNDYRGLWRGAVIITAACCWLLAAGWCCWLRAAPGSLRGPR